MRNCTLSSQTGSKNIYKSVDSVNTVNQKIQEIFLKIERDRGILEPFDANKKCKLFFYNGNCLAFIIELSSDPKSYYETL